MQHAIIWVSLLLAVCLQASAYYLSQPLVLGHGEEGDKDHVIYINVNGGASGESGQQGYQGYHQYSSPCDDPNLRNHLVNCPYYSGAVAVGK